MSITEEFLSRHVVITVEMRALVEQAAEVEVERLLREADQLMSLSMDCISVVEFSGRLVVLDYPGARTKKVYVFEADTFLADLRKLQREGFPS